jgi:phenylpropionate dioxygenase-like ring-hydroxylating dioxygenase large terminal subunit
VLPGRHDAQALVRNAGGVELLSNVCRHRQALMLSGKGNAQNIVCPIHRWTYDLKGELLGAPHFTVKPCASLARSPLRNWNGLLFDGPRDVARDLAGLTLREFDFSGYVLHRIDLHECRYNWKTFLEVYLEDYHVEPFHPGLGKFVTCDDLRWEFADWASVQRVGINSGLARPGTRTYERWHKAVLDYYRGEQPAHGAIWLTYYPNIMVEWYPHVLVISTLYPQAVDRTLNVVEFYYPEDIALFEPEFVEAEQAAYHETAKEDDEIAERMDAGRKALHAEGRSEVGPYQSPMEDGMQHFHEFYRREMESAIAHL